MRRAALSFLLAIAALLPLGAASGFLPPQGAETTAGAVTLAYWVGNETAADAPVPPGGAGEAWFALAKAQLKDGQPLAVNGTTIAFVNVTSEVALFADPNVTITLDRRLTSEWTFARAAFTLPENATGSIAYRFHVDAFDVDGENWTALGSLEGGHAIGVQTVAPAPPGGLPTSWLVGGAAVVLVAVGAGAWMARERAQRRRMRGETRSRALREAELEERARRKPEEAAVIQQEIRAEEKVRERRRDLQILDAKRADALKSIELLRKRHESGGLTKLQYDNMVAKKQADLQRIEAEIAAAEAEDASRGAAA